MKKKVLALIMLITVVVTVFTAGQPVFADDKYYYISGYNINVDVLPDGSANIEERLTYNFNGDFNGILRDIDYSSTGGIENLQVFVERNGNEEEFTVNSTRDLDAGGSVGTFNQVENGRLSQLKIYEKSSNMMKTFIIKYTFRDVCTKYKDIAEFNRKIVDSGWAVPISNVVINIRLPEGAQQSEIKVFAHGPLTGESRILDNRNVQFTLDSLSPGNWVETLVVFPTSLLPDASNVVNEEALPQIMENERVEAEKANLEREEARRYVAEYERRHAEELARKAAIRPIGNAIGITFFLLWFVLIIYIYIKYDKELKHNFEGKYYRELPGEYTPAEMSVLLTMGSVGTRDITATLMDLVRKEQLLLTSETYLKKGFFKDKEVQDYVLSINQNAPNAHLKKHEAYLIDWFIGRVGDGYSLRLDEISDYCKTRSGARTFTNNYSTWRDHAKKEASKNNFFDNTSKKGQIIGILSSLAYLGLGILLFTVLESGFGFALLAQFIVMIIFAARLNRRTSYGNEQNAMWNAFKNFLKDFSNMEKAGMPSIVIWEHYLVYAISLGVAKEVIRQLPLVFNDADLQDTHLTYMRGYSFYNFANFTDAFDRTIDTVDHAVSQAIAVANSTNSSSSGGGGGFSGGSSGGGGGGGGGGAF